jgi:hypothetical protein
MFAHLGLHSRRNLHRKLTYRKVNLYMLMFNSPVSATLKRVGLQSPLRIFQKLPTIRYSFALLESEM